ncbi:MAG: hypothetical protein ACRDDA_01875 [Aeromonas sp.]
MLDQLVMGYASQMSDDPVAFVTRYHSQTRVLTGGKPALVDVGK